MDNLEEMSIFQYSNLKSALFKIYGYLIKWGLNLLL